MRRGNGPKPFFAALGVTVLGVVWLVGALALFNIFFSYPIILIVVGIIGMIANASGLVRRPQPQLPQQRMPYAVPPSQPMYYPPPMPQSAPPAALCWQCGRPNEGRPVCATCGAAQYSQLPQQPMGPYGAAPGYPSAPGYPQVPGYLAGSGYPPAPSQPPASSGWPQPPQQPPHSQSW